ncbi:MAG TPA: TetR/AcrR family transcriptional regulator [Candidatus Limiplasma sp.]|nr:TetR/AcrR family transcriptional regulator [Candidatus Limiplasma sp.]HRX08262.1 TetR/AcrR family transcriptional regulator [Candidatus Limiplasma sp.]
MRILQNRDLTSRQFQAEETHKRIYDTAFGLMTKKGFDRITIKDISKKAGVSIGTFYHYYKSKDEILHEVYKKADDYFKDSIANIQAESTPEIIIEYFRYYARFSKQNTVGFTTHLYNIENKFFLKKGRLMQTVLADILRKGQEAGEILTAKTPDELVDYLFLIARGIVFDWGLRDGQYDIEEKMTEIMTLQVQLLKA